MQIVVFVVFLLNLCNVEPSPHRPSVPLFNWSTPGLGSHFSVFVYLYLRIWHIFQLETLYQATVSPDRTFTFLLVFVFVSIPNHLSFVICTKASIRQVSCPQTELSLFCSLLFFWQQAAPASNNPPQLCLALKKHCKHWKTLKNIEKILKNIEKPPTILLIYA